jgi:hypothetical protein
MKITVISLAAPELVACQGLAWTDVAANSHAASVPFRPPPEKSRNADIGGLHD